MNGFLRTGMCFAAVAGFSGSGFSRLPDQAVGDAYRKRAWMQVGAASDALSDWGRAVHQGPKGNMAAMRKQRDKFRLALGKLAKLSPPKRFEAIQADLVEAFVSPLPLMQKAIVSGQKGDMQALREADRRITVEFVPKIRRAKAALYAAGSGIDF